jgi:hypothetical protein
VVRIIESATSARGRKTVLGVSLLLSWASVLVGLGTMVLGAMKEAGGTIIAGAVLIAGGVIGVAVAGVVPTLEGLVALRNQGAD